MNAQVRLPEPIVETVLQVEPNKKVLGPKLKSAPKGALKELCDKLEAMTSDEALVCDCKRGYLCSCSFFSPFFRFLQKKKKKKKRGHLLAH